MEFLFTFAARLKFNGTLAQLVEQRTENPCVTGSIPVGTTALKPLIVKQLELLRVFSLCLDVTQKP